MENWPSPENDFCLVFWFLVIGLFKKKLFCFFSMKNTKEVHMRQRLFLHYGWFLQNLEKGFIQSDMHTTAAVDSFDTHNRNYDSFCNHRIFEFSSDQRDKRHHKPSKAEFLEIDWATNKPSRIQKNSLEKIKNCLLYTSPSPRDEKVSRMPSSA